MYTHLIQEAILRKMLLIQNFEILKYLAIIGIEKSDTAKEAWLKGKKHCVALAFDSN